MRRLGLIVGFLGAIAGCGPSSVRLDTTNDRTARASFAAMTSGMSAESRDRFLGDCDTLVSTSLEMDDFHDPGSVEESLRAEPLRPLDGMTAGEISRRAFTYRHPVAAALLDAVPGAVAATALTVIGVIMARRHSRRVETSDTMAGRGRRSTEEVGGAHPTKMGTDETPTAPA